MNTILPFDEINALNHSLSQRSMSIDQYFSEMALPEREIDFRAEFAREMEGILFMCLAYIYTSVEMGGDIGTARNIAIDMTEDSLIALVNRYIYADAALRSYIRTYLEGFANTTIDRANIYLGGSLPDKVSYWFSTDRARFNAENETNTIFNYDQYKQAQDRNRQNKQWKTMKDELVRPTHSKVDDVIIPIDAFFQVGDCMMLYPKDVLHGTSDEIVNCRCTIRYF